MPWYFAYGSNMQSETLRGRRGVDYRRAVPVRAPGWRLVFDKPPPIPIGHASANIIPDPEAETLGVAFEISAADLVHVERTEGVSIGNYRRVTIAVQSLQPTRDAPTTAYSLTSDRRDATLFPSTRYMGLVIAGALEHGLPAEYVEGLRGVPAEPEGRAATAMRPIIDRVLRRR